jgi:hypothetical protein
MSAFEVKADMRRSTGISPFDPEQTSVEPHFYFRK